MSKTKKKKKPAGNSCPPPTISPYVFALKNIVTALLEYFDLDSSIRVSRIIDAVELDSLNDSYRQF